MNYKFERADYVEAIDRELAKRSTAYPKIIQKMKKREADPEEFYTKYREQEGQLQWLRNARTLILCYPVINTTDLATKALAELTREYKMRQRCYPRWVALGRMDSATVEYELGVWKEMCFWFSQEYLGLDHLPPLTKRSKPTYP